MKRFLFFVVFVTVVLISTYTACQAQVQYTGCLYNSNIHQTRNGNSGGVPNYNTSPNITSASAFCVVNTGSNCRAVSYTHLDVYKRQEYICQSI